jgi:hypothetical protein
MTETCPICGSDLNGISTQFHVRFVHLTRQRCWCGQDIYALRDPASVSYSDRFTAHCDSHGGYLAHYLACTLGVPDG